MDFRFSDIDPKRKKAALDGSLTPLEVRFDERSGQFASSDGSPHIATLHDCSCMDFRINLSQSSPCKHIIRLAMELGECDSEGMVTDQTAALAKHSAGVLEWNIRNIPISEAAELITICSALKNRKGIAFAPDAFAFVGVPNIIEAGIAEQSKDGKKMTLSKAGRKVVATIETVFKNRVGGMIVDSIDKVETVEFLKSLESDRNV